MQEPEMLTNHKYDFNIWQETWDPVFSEISEKSRININWLTYSKILDSEYKDCVIKPVNNYVRNLYPAPQLISIENNTVRLRQGNHAEFFLLKKENGNFFNLDRPWMRQYYKTKEKFDLTEECFPSIYKFYVPWFIDENIIVRFERPTTDSPFYINPSEHVYKKTTGDEKYIEPAFVTFAFKKVGPHMVTEDFGKIKRQQAMFDIVFDANDIIIDRVKEFYEKYNPLLPFQRKDNVLLA